MMNQSFKSPILIFLRLFFISPVINFNNLFIVSIGNYFFVRVFEFIYISISFYVFNDISIKIVIVFEVSRKYK